MTMIVPLSDAKARLSEIVRAVRQGRAVVTITVDGQPAARLVPAASEPRPLTAAEVATERALLAALDRIPRVEGAFDAVELVREGRR
jgi:prevent-host-death family protein